MSLQGFRRRYNNCSEIENFKRVSLCLIKSKKCIKALKIVADTNNVENILKYGSMYKSRTNGHNRPVINPVNPFKRIGISHCYQLDKSIFVLRFVGW